MLEWFYFVLLGILTTWNIARVIRNAGETVSRSRRYQIISLNKYYNKKILVLVFIMCISYFLYNIYHSIQTIFDLEQYGIPLMIRISTSGLMINIYLLSLLPIIYWKGVRGDYFYDNGIVLNNQLIPWKNVKNHSLSDKSIEIEYIDKKGNFKSRLIKKNENSNELIKKLS